MWTRQHSAPSGWTSPRTGIRHPFRLARPYLLRAALSAVVFPCATPAASQPFQVLGPSECINCHDHENQKTWWQPEDGPPPNGHINALNKMEDLRTPDLAAAIGLADPYDSNGPCVRCHATVYKGEAYNGVSCESCHGPGSGYLEIHQEEDSRTRSVAAGLNDVFGNVEAWAEACMNCHLMDDQRLVAAGHPSGEDFNLSEKFSLVALHWNTDYDRDAVTTAARRAVQMVTARRAENTAAAEVAAMEQAMADAAAAEQAVAEAAAAEGAAAEAAEAQRIAEEAAAAERAAAEREAAARAVVRAVVPSTGLPTAAAAARPPAPVVDEAGNPLAAPDVAAILPLSSSELVAEVQGRLIAVLDALLRRGGRAPVRVTPSEIATEYDGDAAALLEVQEAALRLALEALGTTPAEPDGEPQDPPQDQR